MGHEALVEALPEAASIGGHSPIRTVPLLLCKLKYVPDQCGMLSNKPFVVLDLCWA
jgi:hypothetical protein